MASGEEISSDESHMAELRQDCQDLWQELQSVQKRVAQSAVSVSNDDSLSEIYKQKEKLLKTQIDVLKQKKVKVQEPAMHILTVKDKLKRLNGQLEETLDRVKEKNSKLEDDIKQADKLRSEQQQVKSTLEERVREQESQVGNADTASIEAQMQEQMTKCTAYYKQTLKEFLPFVRKHYPTPGDSDTSINKSRVTSQDDDNDVISLSSMLEALMNKSIENPSDPYVCIDPRIHWQPYVELLLRSKITVRHPNNEHLMKITPFHL